MGDVQAFDTDVSRSEVLLFGIAYFGAALALLWPALGPGALFNLDLLITRHADVGGGIWGLGPELPRLIPLEVPIGAIASLSSGWIVKWILVVAPALGATGAHRLARLAGVSSLPAAGAGVLYGFGPWMMTRVTVGHLTMIGTAAALPWVVRPLMDGRAGRRLVLASVSLAMFGFYGGLVGGIVVLAAAIGAKAPPKRAVVVRFVLPQLVWLVPGSFVWASVGPFGGGDLFMSGVDELADTPALLVGYGFWQEPLQVGGDPGALEAGLGLLVASAAGAGLRTLGSRTRRAVAALIAIPLILVAADSIPGVRDWFGVLTELGPLASVREPQRLLVLTLLVVSVAAALGADTARARFPTMWGPALLVAPIALAAVLAAPAAPHIRERLNPVELPDEWSQARSAIASDPGSVLVLPFNRYLNFGLADSRRVLNPALAYFAPLSIVSSDLGLDKVSSERADPREPSIIEAVARLSGPDSDATVLGDLGIDWVLILHEINYERYLVLLDDPALQSEIAAGSLDLLRVRDGRGAAVAADGSAVGVAEVVQPLLRVDTEQAVTLDRPYQWGWMRGLSPIERSPDGRLLADGSSQWIWYWPAALVLVVDAGVAVRLAVWLLRPPRSSNATGGGPPRTAFSRFARLLRRS